MVQRGIKEFLSVRNRDSAIADASNELNNNIRQERRLRIRLSSHGTSQGSNHIATQNRQDIISLAHGSNSSLSTQSRQSEDDLISIANSTQSSITNMNPPLYYDETSLPVEKMNGFSGQKRNMKPLYSLIEHRLFYSPPEILVGDITRKLPRMFLYQQVHGYSSSFRTCLSVLSARSYVRLKHSIEPTAFQDFPTQTLAYTSDIQFDSEGCLFAIASVKGTVEIHEFEPSRFENIISNKSKPYSSDTFRITLIHESQKKPELVRWRPSHCDQVLVAFRSDSNLWLFDLQICQENRPTRTFSTRQCNGVIDLAFRDPNVLLVAKSDCVDLIDMRKKGCGTRLLSNRKSLASMTLLDENHLVCAGDMNNIAFYDIRRSSPSLGNSSFLFNLPVNASLVSDDYVSYIWSDTASTDQGLLLQTTRGSIAALSPRDIMSKQPVIKFSHEPGYHQEYEIRQDNRFTGSSSFWKIWRRRPTVSRVHSGYDIYVPLVHKTAGYRVVRVNTKTDTLVDIVKEKQTKTDVACMSHHPDLSYVLCGMENNTVEVHGSGPMLE